MVTVPESLRLQVPAPTKVGGRLARYAQAWAERVPDLWVLQVLREGYQIPFLRNPPALSPSPISLTAYQPGSEKFLVLVSEVQAMLEKEAVEVVSDHSAGFYNRLFAVQKASGGWRPVLDVSVLNTFVVLTKFKMESPRSVLHAVRRNDWMLSIDLQDAYFHVPVHPASRKFLRFVFAGVVYQFRALPFGLSTAPQVFTRVFAQVAKWLHLAGIRVVFYLDDWLVLDQSRSRILEACQYILDLSLELGFVVNLKKSNLVPSQQVIYLGMNINSLIFWVSPKESRVTKFLRLLGEFLTCSRPPANFWQVILGHMTSLEVFIPGARLRMREVQFWLHQCWDMVSNPLTYRIRLSDHLLPDLLWWNSEPRLRQGVPIQDPLPTLFLYSDASTQGWGASMGDHRVSGLWSRQEQSLHINILELRAVRLAMVRLEPFLVSCVVAVLMDNTTALSYIRKQGGTVSKSLFQEARLLHLWAEERSILIKTCFVPGERNVVADSLSRAGQVLPREWTLNMAVCRQLWRLWGQPQVDLFATRDNCRLSIFVSPTIDVQAWATDAMLIRWEDLYLYAYPPLSMISEVLSRFDQFQNVRMILIAPFWPRQHWFPLLYSLCQDHPRLLPQRVDLLRQPYVNRVHHDLGALALTAWSLSSVASERKAFQERLPRGLQLSLASPHVMSINTSGRSSETGVSPEMFPRPRPL